VKNWVGMQSKVGEIHRKKNQKHTKRNCAGNQVGRRQKPGGIDKKTRPEYVKRRPSKCVQTTQLSTKKGGPGGKERGQNLGKNMSKGDHPKGDGGCFPLSQSYLFWVIQSQTLL
jgi:hypothetical protein